MADAIQKIQSAILATEIGQWYADRADFSKELYVFICEPMGDTLGYYSRRTGKPSIVISIEVDNTDKFLTTLTHEIIHDFCREMSRERDGYFAHQGWFIRVAKRLGMRRPWTETKQDEINDMPWLQEIKNELGELPLHCTPIGREILREDLNKTKCLSRKN